MTAEELEQRVKEAFAELSKSDKVRVWNEYCDKVNCFEDRIYQMYELDYLKQGTSPLDILKEANGNDFNPFEDYFKDTVFGIESRYECEVDDWIEEDDVVDCIVRNMDSLGCSDIQDVLDEYYYGDDEEDELEELN